MTDLSRRTAVGLLGLALLALALAPLLLPAGYSVITHSVSESAAQGLEGGWLARSGLVMFGVAVVFLVIAAPRYWGGWARIAHLLFGVAMITTATFSHAPWDGSPGDMREDTIHSVASFGVGFSFIVGVALVALRRPSEPTWRRVLDWTAVTSGVLIPLLMTVVGQPGLIQRSMFLVAFAWYGLEAAKPGTARGL